MSDNEESPETKAATISARTGKILFAVLVIMVILILVAMSIFSGKATTAEEEDTGKPTASSTQGTLPSLLASGEDPSEPPEPSLTPTATPTKNGTTAPDTAPSLLPYQEDELFLAEHAPLDRAMVIALTLSGRDWQDTPAYVLGYLSTMVEKDTMDNTVTPLVLGWDWEGCRKAKCSIIGEARDVSKTEIDYGYSYVFTIFRNSKAGRLPPEKWQIDMVQWGEQDTWQATSIKKVA